MNGVLRPDDSVFEAGCGVLAFLNSCLLIESNLTIGGVDGAKKTIGLVKDTLVDPRFKDNFFVGMLPDALDSVPSNSWDVVTCNSVFQYLVDKEQAKKAVEGMIRVAKRWVVIADICDEKYAHITNNRKSGLSWAEGLPEYRCYSKSWWEDNFDQGDHLVSIRHVEVQHYARRKERYVVYIEKNAPVQSPVKKTP